MLKMKTFAATIICLSIIAWNYTAFSSAVSPAFSINNINPIIVATTEDWPMFRHDLNHSGYSTSEAPDSNNIRWKIPIYPPIRSSPAVVGGVVYLGSSDGYVHAINATNGQYMWPKQSVGGPSNSSLAVADGKIFIGSSDGRVYALNATAGTPIWTTTYVGTVESSPAVADGLVFVGTSSGIYAFYEQSGVKKWNFTTEPVRSSPAIANGILFVGSDDNYVYALNATNGDLLWSQDLLARVKSSPAIADGTVFVGSENSRLYALNSSDGTIKWQFIAGSLITSSPAVAGGKIFVGSEDKKVYALNHTDPNGDGIISPSEVIWDFTTGDKVRSSPAVADGKVFVGSDDKSVYAINATTKALVWKYPTSNKVYSSPAIASTPVGGMVFVGSDDGNLYAFGSPNQTPIALFDFSPKNPSALKQVTFDASASYDPDGAIRSYSWDFDGDSVADQNSSSPIATYSYPQAGNYTVSLTVTDDFKDVAKNFNSTSISVSDIWPMFRHDTSHSGYAISRAAITNRTLWTFPTGDEVKSSPAVFDGKVYIGSDNGSIYAIDAVTGENVWKASIGKVTLPFPTSSPTVADGLVFIGSEDGKVYAFNATTGDPAWPPQLIKGRISSSPTVKYGRVFIGSQNNSITALNATTGAQLWTRPTGDDVESSPAVVNGTVFVSSRDYYIYAFDAYTGNPVWNKTEGATEGAIVSSPIIVGDKVIVGSDDGCVYAFTVRHGSILWKVNLTAPVESSPAVADDLIIVGADNGYVYALNQTNGWIVWRYKTNGAVKSSPAIGETVGRLLIYVGSEDGKLYALSKMGGLYWSLATGGSIVSSPAVWNGTIFVDSNNKSVYAIRDLEGYAVHDIAVIHRVRNVNPYFFEPCKTAIAQNYSVDVIVLIENQGTFQETFDVTFYVTTAIGTRLVTDLSPGASVFLTFRWNTTGYGMNDYTIIVYASPVAQEMDRTDNTLSDKVAVTYVGDVDGSFNVTILDVVKITSIYGATTNDPYFVPNSDINGDGKIDILDVVLCTGNYGKPYP